MPIRLMGGVGYPDSGFPTGRHQPALAGSKPETHTTQRGPQGFLPLSPPVSSKGQLVGSVPQSHTKQWL